MTLCRMILALTAVLAAGTARAQTYDPIQAQERLNRQQLDMQSQQLLQLQRQDAQAPRQADPAARLRIQQQTETVDRLRQQMLSSSMAPSALGAQIQANGARIQPIQPRAPIP